MVIQRMKAGTNTMRGAIQNADLSRDGWGYVFLQEEFEGVGDGLEDAVEPGAHGTHAHLDAAQSLALKVGQSEDDNSYQADDGQYLEDGEEHVVPTQRSTSPSTISMEPRMTTASAT